MKAWAGAVKIQNTAARDYTLGDSVVKAKGKCVPTLPFSSRFI